MTLRLKRISDAPILEPNPDLPWEAGAVFNCAAVAWNEQVHLIYRATDIASNGKDGPFISRLGYAVSSDGISFERLPHPVYANEVHVEQEQRGAEDPRIVRLGGTFYMTYTGYGGRFDGDYRISLAISHNLIDWNRVGVLLDEPNKDAALFPDRVNAKFMMLHRRPPNIWVAESDDLRSWSNHSVLLRPDPSSAWEALKIGAAGPPIMTQEGWLLIYHGVSEDHRYCLGAALLDPSDPTRIIARQAEPILKPELAWEREGHVPNVVFSCGHIVKDDLLHVYYGAADNVIGLATAQMSDIRLA